MILRNCHKTHKDGQIGLHPGIEVRDKYLHLNEMMHFRCQNRIGKACALVAATLILPVLAHAQNPNGTNQNGTKQNGTNQNVPPAVPEVNTAWVLVPFLGGVLLYSWRRLSKAKA
jgi:hypothetical protein